MKWIGITGSMGSGKSTVSDLIEGMGYPVVRADDISRRMTSRGSVGLQKIVDHFGNNLLNSNGELDRKALADQVFGKADKLKELESILHPLIQQEVLRWRKSQDEAGAKFAFYDIPLLFENNLQKNFDVVICVVAPEEAIVERVIRRSGLSEDEIHKRLSHQVPVNEKIQKSDFVIDNSGTLNELRVKVQKLLTTL